jgi:lipopolysaccharide transport system permease protein
MSFQGGTSITAPVAARTADGELRPQRGTDPPMRVAAAPTIISPHRGWFDWRLNELWRYRDLISLLVWRDFVSVYKQTILGPAWHIVQPLMTTLTFTVIFSRVAGLSTDGAPPFLFYMAGFVPWTYFATCLNYTSTTFVTNAPLLGKVYFHRMVIPVSVVISGLIAFVIQFGIFLGLLLASGLSGVTLHITSRALLTPLLLLMLAGYALGAGIIVCAMTTRYRDLKHLATFGVQLLMYASPVIYPASAVPAGYRWVLRMNPLTPIIESFRLGFLGAGTATVTQLAGSFVGMLVILAVGLMLFNRVERTFMDTV